LIYSVGTEIRGEHIYLGVEKDKLSAEMPLREITALSGKVIVDILAHNGASTFIIGKDEEKSLAH
jgi:hypothetical protein